jgi:hypothetical protein
MRILVINNDGGGFADYINVEAGLSVQQLFEQQVPYGKPRDYLIRVNRQPTAPDQLLQEGDRVSFTPTKIEGAAAGSRPACCLWTSPGESSPCLSCHN